MLIPQLELECWGYCVLLHLFIVTITSKHLLPSSQITPKILTFFCFCSDQFSKIDVLLS